MGEFRKKAAICIITPGDINNVLGGMEHFTASLSSWLQKQSYDVVVIHRSLFGRIEAIINPPSRTKDVRSHKINSSAKRIPYLFYMVFSFCLSIFKIFKIISLNKKFNFRVLHAIDLAYDGFAAVIASWIINVPVVSHCHGIRYYNLQKQLSKQKMAKICSLLGHSLEVFVVKHSKFVVTVNTEARNFFVSLGCSPQKITVTPMGIETSAFFENRSTRNNVRQELRVEKGEILICFIGRLSQEKNVTTLINTYVSLLSQGRLAKSRLLIVGSGPLRSELKDKVPISFKEKIVFMGTRSDIPRLLQGADIFVLPSIFEGCPIALIEAMASGKAIVASIIPSVREIIRDGHNGVLVNPWDNQGLERSLERLYADRSLRIKLGKNAKETVARYDICTLFPQILEIYEEAIRSCLR